jgi:molybdopterin/thiamine biosynthesis adenylyltransferase
MNAPVTPALAPRISWEQIVDRQSGLLSAAQNEAIRGTRLLMLGVGGMGMNAAALLIRAGFEKFTLVDFDTVDGTSANRTPFAFDDTLGLQKTEAARRYMLKINPGARIRALSGVKLGLDTDPAVVRDLVEEHDVLSWAMDGIAGRICYTRAAYEVGRRLPAGKPAVESWAVPWRFTVMTVPNREGTPGWEECFDLPTAGRPVEEIGTEDLRAAGRRLLETLAASPGAAGNLDSDLVSRWLRMEIPNRSLGHAVTGSAALIAHQMLVCALELAGLPLRGARSHLAPWLAVHDVLGHSACEYNLRTRQVRWRHPLTGELVTEPGGADAPAGGDRR